VPEPRGLSRALLQVPDRTLNESELEHLRRDGVVLLQGVVPDKRLLAGLAAQIWKHADMRFEETFINQKTWLFNGAVRTLLRDGPLEGIAHSAYNLTREQNVYAGEAPVWGWPRRKTQLANSWHADARASKDQTVTIWLLLVDASHSLEFILGSHNTRDAMEEQCAYQVPGGKLGFKSFNTTCLDNFTSNLPNKGHFRPYIEAGDAFVFNGNVLHRGIRQTYDRLAISIRFLPLDPELQTPSMGTPVLVPRGSASFDGAPWAVLPGTPNATPWLPVQWGWLLWLLHL